MTSSQTARAVIVHGLGDARAALAAARAVGRPVRLLSAPAAGAYAGGAWFTALVRLARDAFPDVTAEAVLDCGDEPGRALAALRAGVAHICLGGNARARAAVADIAAASGATVEPPCGEALDLAGLADAEAACRAWLAGP